MLRETSSEIEDGYEIEDVLEHHSLDPFACPCCANVFAELVRLAGVDLAEHGAGLTKRTPTVAPSLLLENARIITMDADQPAAQAMLVEGGRIRWIGANEDKPEVEPGVQSIDLVGKVVLPGFIEPHMHLAPLAMLQAFENVGPFRFPTIAEAVEHLQAIAAGKADGEWVLGRQFDPSLQTGPEYLTREMLDAVSTTLPVFVYNASLHLAYCNSRALEIAGIDRDSVAPTGSEIGTDSSGEPNGVLKGGPAMALVARHNPALRQRNVAEDCLEVFRHANSLGITMLADQGTGLFQGVRELDLYKSLRDSNRMTARFRFSLGQAIAERWDETDVAWGQGDEWVQVTGWKIVSDGSNQGRTGLQRDPFLNSEDHGLAYIEVDELNAAVEKRLREGWAVCIHANGDAAIDRALDAYAKAAEQGLDPGSMRCRIEHCSILHDEHIERMAQLGISPSFLIGHVYYWGKAFVEDVFGLEKASKLDRTGACEDAGIRWTVHSDDPVTEMGPLRCMQNAVTRAMWKSDALLSPEERIPVEAALRAATIDAAWQCHSDHEVGSLEIGKFADFVVLGEDPREVDPTQLDSIDILETWVGGEAVYKN